MAKLEQEILEDAFHFTYDDFLINQQEGRATFQQQIYLYKQSILRIGGAFLIFVVGVSVLLLMIDFPSTFDDFLDGALSVIPCFIPIGILTAMLISYQIGTIFFNQDYVLSTQGTIILHTKEGLYPQHRLTIEDITIMINKKQFKALTSGEQYCVHTVPGGGERLISILPLQLVETLTTKTTPSTRQDAPLPPAQNGLQKVFNFDDDDFQHNIARRLSPRQKKRLIIDGIKSPQTLSMVYFPLLFGCCFMLAGYGSEPIQNLLIAVSIPLGIALVVAWLLLMPVWHDIRGGDVQHVCSIIVLAKDMMGTYSLMVLHDENLDDNINIHYQYKFMLSNKQYYMLENHATYYIYFTLNTHKIVSIQQTDS